MAGALTKVPKQVSIETKFSLMKATEQVPSSKLLAEFGGTVNVTAIQKMINNA
jgi:hypothetical protein